MTYFMIGGDQREYGPVDAEVVRQWLKEGRANADTLIRPEGETLWKPIRTYAEFEADLPPGAAASAASDQAPVPPTASGAVPAEIPVRIGAAFSRACALLGQRFATIAAATLIVWMVVTALMWIPCGPFVLMFLKGPIYGGYFLFFLALIRGAEVSAGEVLMLSRESFTPLALAGFATTILTELGFVCCIIPGLYLLIAWLLAFPLIADKKVDMWTGMEWSRQIVTRRWFHFLALFIVAFLPVLVFHMIMTARINSELLKIVMDMVGSGPPPDLGRLPQFMQEFGVKAQDVLRSLGWMAYARQFLLLVTLPLGVGTFAWVYEDIFGPQKRT